jgi:hypothetical protein
MGLKIRATLFKKKVEPTISRAFGVAKKLTPNYKLNTAAAREV